MIIDTATYKLDENQYLVPEAIKKQIVIGHTGTMDMKHVTKWKTRLNGNYKKTAAFTISKSGQVFNHFDPIFSSTILNNPYLDKRSIVILLENEGWLSKDGENNEFIDWLGYIYNKPEEIIEKKWRNYQYWSPYTIEQFEATVALVNHLCEEFYINRYTVPHNTKLDDLLDFEGIMYRSNLDINYTDLNPSWDFNLFKQRIENEDQ
jgi:hypothetical protein